MQQPGFPQQPCKIWEMTRAQHRAGSRFLALLTPGAMVIFPCAYRTHFCIYLSFAMRQNTKSTATPQAVNKNDDQAGCKDAWKPLCPHTRPPVPPSHTPTPKRRCPEAGKEHPTRLYPQAPLVSPKNSIRTERTQHHYSPTASSRGPSRRSHPPASPSAARNPSNFSELGARQGFELATRVPRAGGRPPRQPPTCAASGPSLPVPPAAAPAHLSLRVPVPCF